eukprot:676048-Amphidinium_carterae.1
MQQLTRHLDKKCVGERERKHVAVKVRCFDPSWRRGAQQVKMFTRPLKKDVDLVQNFLRIHTI